LAEKISLDLLAEEINVNSEVLVSPFHMSGLPSPIIQIQHPPILF
jgi:hypothetical protein